MTERQDDRIRLFIVDDNAPTVDSIRRLLQFEADISVIGSARTFDEALEFATREKPHVVLMDINLGGENEKKNGIVLTKNLKQELRFTQIIILSVQAEPDYMRRAMQAGACDYLSKPPASDELISAIRRAGEKAKEIAKVPELPVGPISPILTQKPRGKLLTVYSPKGGVGCTTLATNLAVGLNSDETPTVLVDGNLQFGDVGVFLNLQPKNSILDLTTASEEMDKDVVEEVLTRHESGLRVLAAPVRPEMADEIRVEDVKKVLMFLKHHYAYIIVDSSSAMDDVTLAILDLSDILLAVATTDIPSIKDARLLFDLLSVLEFPKENLLFVLNKTNQRTGITAKRVSENLRVPVEAEIPADDLFVANSVNKGVPLLLGDKNRPIVKDLLDLLGVVKERLMREEVEETESAEAVRYGR